MRSETEIAYFSHTEIRVYEEVISIMGDQDVYNEIFSQLLTQ